MAEHLVDDGGLEARERLVDEEPLERAPQHGARLAEDGALVPGDESRDRLVVPKEQPSDAVDRTNPRLGPELGVDDEDERRLGRIGLGGPLREDGERGHERGGEELTDHR